MSKHMLSTAPKQLSTQRQQQGVALLIVLMLVVSITILAGAMLAKQKITIRQSELLFNQNQINSHLHTGKYSALAIIEKDSQLNQFDSKQDIWANEISKQTTADGYEIKLTIHDAASKFNINNLYHHGKADRQYIMAFQRLLESLSLDTNLVKIILDWQDPNDKVYQDGGDESAVYQSSMSANNKNNNGVANQPFVSVDQLLELPDIDNETLDKLKPYITAVPYVLPINVNTAKEEVLAAVLGDKAEAQNLISQQGNLDSLEKLKQQNLFAQVKSKKKRAQAIKMLDVNSQAFEVVISVNNEDNSKQRYATMMIAKPNAQTMISSAAPSASALGYGTNATATNNELIISDYNYRVWAFKPNLFY